MPGGDPRASRLALCRSQWKGVGARGHGGDPGLSSSWGVSGGRGFREPRRCYVGLEPQSGIPLERQALKSHQETRLREGRPRISSLPHRSGNQVERSLWPRAPTPGSRGLPPAPNPLHKSAKRKRLDFAPLSSIFCLMSPGLIVGEGSSHPGHKFVVMVPPAALLLSRAGML